MLQKICIGLLKTIPSLHYLWQRWEDLPSVALREVWWAGGGGTLLIAMVKPGFCIHHTHIVPNNLQYLSLLPTFQQTHIVKPILMTNAGEKIKKKKNTAPVHPLAGNLGNNGLLFFFQRKKNHLSDPAEKFFPALQLAMLQCAAVTEQLWVQIKGHSSGKSTARTEWQVGLTC